MSIPKQIKQTIKDICHVPQLWMRTLQTNLCIRRLREYQIEPLSAFSPEKCSGSGVAQTAEREVVVALTSYDRRLETLDLAIKSVFMQSVRPNRIVLYLGKDCDNVELPPQLTELEKYGLEIRRGCEDLKPHKKYFYALQEFPQSLVITIDDDCVYKEDFIETLIKGHKVFPNAVIARRVNRVEFDGNGQMLSYVEWTMEWKSSEITAATSLVATGCGGILYPAYLFSREDFDLDMIRGIALSVDDLYLKLAELKKGIKTVYVPNDLNNPYSIRERSKLRCFQAMFAETEMMKLCRNLWKLAA